MVGDGSYLMIPGELADRRRGAHQARRSCWSHNHGYASIGALSRSVGAAGFGTHYRCARTALPLDARRRRPAAARAAAGRPRGERREPRRARAARATIDELRAALARRARRRRAGRHPHRDRPLRGRARATRAGGTCRSPRSRATPAVQAARARVRARAARAQRRHVEAAVTTCSSRRGAVVTPESAGWSYVGFEPLQLAAGSRRTRDRRARVLRRRDLGPLSTCAPSTATGAVSAGARVPFAGPPDAAYLPPGTALHASAAPPRSGSASRRRERAREPRVLPATGVVPETRGHGAHERTIHRS